MTRVHFWGRFCCPWQVLVFWQLVAYYTTNKYKDKNVVFLNVDETSIPYNLLPFPGCVATHGKQPPRMAVRKEDVRGALTYVAIICDLVDMQGKLPHYVFGSETKLTKKLLRGQRCLPQTTLRIVRQKSGWTSSDNIIMILRDLAKVLKAWPTLQPILLLDAASPHLSKAVMQSARRHGIQLLYIPAGCTDKLQPLDTHAFSAFKAQLKRRYSDLRSGSPHGLPDPLEWLFELMECPRSFFAARRWQRAFAAVGAAKPANVTHLHRDLREFMQFPGNMPEGIKPSKEQLQSIFPERRRMAYAFRALL